MLPRAPSLPRYNYVFLFPFHPNVFALDVPTCTPCSKANWQCFGEVSLCMFYASWTIQLLSKIQTLSKRYQNILVVSTRVHWYWREIGLHTHIMHSNINRFKNWFEASMLDPSMNDEEWKLQIAQRSTCRHTKRNIWKCNIEKDWPKSSKKHRNQHLISNCFTSANYLLSVPKY
jgi:hypothetical protein